MLANEDFGLGSLAEVRCDGKMAKALAYVVFW
jgi:hypothetical protein